MLFILKKFLFYTKEVDTPFDISANLLALKSRGNNNLVLLFDLNNLESSFSRSLVGWFI